MGIAENRYFDESLVQKMPGKAILQGLPWQKKESYLLLNGGANNASPFRPGTIVIPDFRVSQ